MSIPASTRTPWCSHGLASGLLLAGLLCAFAPAASCAAVTTFGSPLSVPATLDTAVNLSYQGTNTAVPPSREAPTGVYHTFHDGADATLWNNQIAGGAPQAPVAGQITSVRLEGCARQPSGAPPPLTQIHFQDLIALPGGGARVNVTTQSFDIPVCGQAGASGSTVTTYVPANFCVAQGDYVAFSEEGGFVASSGIPPYPAGVPYMVIGAVSGSNMVSFIRNNGVGNGATFSPGDRTYHDGWADNPNAELLLQATLASGSDATPLCPGGTQGVHPPASRAVLPAVRISRQTEWVNHGGIVAIAVYCRPRSGCRGTATLTSLGRQARKATYGHTGFRLRGNATSHLPIRLTSRMIRLLRTHHGRVNVLVSAVVAGKTFSQTISLRIF